MGRMIQNQYLTTKEVAARLEIHPRTVARLVKRNEIEPAARLDISHYGSFMFDPAEVERVAALRAKKSEAAK